MISVYYGSRLWQWESQRLSEVNKLCSHVKGITTINLFMKTPPTLKRSHCLIKSNAAIPYCVEPNFVVEKLLFYPPTCDLLTDRARHLSAHKHYSGMQMACLNIHERLVCSKELNEFQHHEFRYHDRTTYAISPVLKFQLSQIFHSQLLGL